MAGGVVGPTDAAAGISLASGQEYVLELQRPTLTLTSVTPNFAPGAAFDAKSGAGQGEADTCDIEYRVEGGHGLLTELQLVIVRKAKPDEVVACIVLDEAARADGDHTYNWDGLGNQGTFCDIHAHVVASPYLVRLEGKTPRLKVESEAKETAVELVGIHVERRGWTPDGAAPKDGTTEYYQFRLAQLGFHPGPIDGIAGSKTGRAVKAFQGGQAGLRATGALDRFTKAVLDETPPSSGNPRYQFILNALGYRCGPIDGIVGRNTRRALTRYRADKGLGPGGLDTATRKALDAEAIPALTARDVLEGDVAAGDAQSNAYPAPGAEKKVFIDCDGVLSPGNIPRKQKYSTEQKRLVRPHFPIRVKPLVKLKNGKTAFAPKAVGPLKVDFHIDPVAPPANLGIPNATTRTYVQTQVTADGHEAVSGHHAHADRGGVRKDDDSGVFVRGKSLDPYEVTFEGPKYRCEGAKGEVDAGTMGVFFSPSTIAGDRFAVVVSVDDTLLDTPPSSPIEEKTGTFVVHRRYRVAKRWYMQYVPRPHLADSAQLGLPNWFGPAFIDFVDPESNPSPKMLQPRVADHEVIDLALFTQLLRDAGYSPTALPAPQIQQRFAANILWPLQPAAVYSASNEQAYYDAIDSEITAFEDRFSKELRKQSLLEAPEGLVVLVFDENAPQAGTMGIANITNPGLQSWGWSILASTGVVHLIFDQDFAPGAINGETLAHEVGHALWLHHASTSSGSLPSTANQQEHNPAEFQSCTMSYVSLAQFCGRCVLKLRGWDEAKV